MRLYSLVLGCALMAWPLNAAMAEDFWIAAKDSGCKIWTDEAPTDKDVVTWSGGCEGGKAAGDGKLEWVTDGKVYGSYDGTMKDGRFHNLGVLRLAAESGGFDQIEGFFKNGEIDGGGLFKDAAGNIYEGELKDGKPHGTGYSNVQREEYLGSFEDGIRQGIGLLITDTEAYLGEFDNDKANGSGVLEDGEGGRYHGQFKDGKPHGFGTYTTQQNAVFQGRFVDGKADGQFLVKADAEAKAVVEAWKDGEKVK